MPGSLRAVPAFPSTLRRAAWAALVSAFALGDAAEPSLPFTRFELANGLEVIVHEDHATPLVAVNVWYRVGSKDEQPDRTGLAHLFEHLMFKGSKNVPDGAMDRLLEEAGGQNNATTSNDRTNYFETLPGSFLELALWIESDRMGWLTDALTQQSLDNQRDVVRNERRQTMENRPYGMAETILFESIYPEGHPYRWPVIGSHEHLQAASLGEVRAFFRKFYAPNRATLALAGDVTPARARELCERWFGELPRGPDVAEAAAPPPVRLDGETRVRREDAVKLSRLYLAWPTPAFYAPGDAELDLLARVLAGGKSGRLYRALVYQQRVAQEVEAYQGSAKLGSLFVITVTAKPGHSLDAIAHAVDAEIDRLRREPPTERELERARSQLEASLLRGLEHVDARADLLNQYRFYTGDPAYLARDLERYRGVSSQDVGRVVREHLGAGRVRLDIVPKESK